MAQVKGSGESFSTHSINRHHVREEKNEKVSHSQDIRGIFWRDRESCSEQFSLFLRDADEYGGRDHSDHHARHTWMRSFPVKCHGAKLSFKYIF